MSQHTEKTSAGAGKGGKADGKQPEVAYQTGVNAKLHSSWFSYVKGLESLTTGGVPAGQVSAAGPSVGGDEKAPGAKDEGPKVGDDLKTSDNPAAKTVHDGKDYTPTWQKVGDEVFKGAPARDQVQQGYLADCYFVAAMAAIAQQRPELIEKMIQDNGDGSVTVTLYNVNGGIAVPGTGGAKQVRITKELPSTSGSGGAYAHGTDKRLWPGLIEKAYVLMDKGGDYQGANAGGSPGEAMQKMVGKPSGGWSTKSKPVDKLFGEMEQLLADKKPLVAASLDKNDYQNNKDLADLADDRVVYAWHAYAVVRVDAKKNEIELYNPWGTKHPKVLNGEDFTKLYTYVYVGNP